jgi:hypothetical protein
MNTVQTKLSCGCWFEYVKGRIAKGQPVRCPLRTAHGLVTVELIHVKRWHAKCRDCRWSRWYGQDVAEAQSAAARHTASTGHMQVQMAHDTVTLDGKGVAWNPRYKRTKSSLLDVRNYATMTELGADEPPPF